MVIERGPTNPKNIPPNVPYENCSYFWEIVSVFWGGGGCFVFLLRGKYLNLCSHIQKITQNPNPILKNTIPFTQTPNMTKYFRTFGNISRNRKSQFYFVICISCIIHIFVWGGFCNFGIV